MPAAPNTAAPSAARPADPRRRHLERLAKAVGARTELRAQIRRTTPSGPAVLHVVNPIVPDLKDDLRCDLLDEVWSLVWSWGDVLGPADDIKGAVSALERVLTVRS
ncbi:hypothetical protein [Actinomadura rayongensis]|uniref:Uncharacterized protein n=1 Tax=Actinomadura rayongensis TaxID=1429076 RepID=A0A6I4W4A6_9ACTN|nr:hypothetical protein [Actinomadura rayongensis]MXQ65017.1 hypothetical protein [Actinomadura rayongensis]